MGANNKEETKFEHVWRDTFICVIIALISFPFVFQREYRALMNHFFPTIPADDIAAIATELFSWAADLLGSLLG